MVDIIRRSPVQFDKRPARVEKRHNWNVVTEYSNEGEDGPWITDLSHKTRWDVQDGNLASLGSSGLSIPENYGESSLTGEMAVNRMNRTQVSVWHFSDDDVEMPDQSAYTETTDATVFLALYGKNVFSITEKLTNLDLNGPDKNPPVLIQGPFSHVPCQILVVNKDVEAPGILLTCSRGYARDMVHALMDAGKEFSLQPAGEDRFKQWINQI
ncbi:MAG: sarcosine oxidase subunit gamma SoxG [Thermodesulfobacteriota bacterium]